VGWWQRSFGESPLQEAVAKQLELADPRTARLAFQSVASANRPRAVLRHFGTIFRRSAALAERLQRNRSEEGPQPPGCFLQVKFAA